MQLKVMIFLILICLGFACHKDDVYIDPDPSVAILGKWEEVSIGNWPDMIPITEPNGYMEFLTDSILREYEYNSGQYYYKKYWIDSLLHMGIMREDGFLVEITYKYQFYDDKLRLDIKAYAIFNTSIFKRIK